MTASNTSVSGIRRTHRFSRDILPRPVAPLAKTFGPDVVPGFVVELERALSEDWERRQRVTLKIEEACARYWSDFSDQWARIEAAFGPYVRSPVVDLCPNHRGV